MELLNIYALLDREDYDVKKLVLNEDIQRELSQRLIDSYRNFNYDFIEFDGNYKPDEDEAFVIEEFELSESIIVCGSNPIGQTLLTENDTELNALFTYIESENAYVFQNVMKNQIITREGFSIFLDQNTFKKIDSLALSIKDEIDCIFKDNKLYFKSYWVARQIFDLREYYKVATNEDLSEFRANDSIKFECIDTFNNNLDTWIRRKVALIQDAGTLDTYQPRKIKEIAAKYSVNIKVEENKMVIPKEKEEVKNILQFLDENIYKGPLTDETYETNSKRQFL